MDNPRIQPHDLDAEKAVLGAMLLSHEAIDKAAAILKDESFYSNANGEIFGTILTVFHRQGAVDTVTVINQLKRKKKLSSVGGSYYVTGLSESVPTAANVQHYAQIVRDKAYKRKIIAVSHELAKSAYDDTIDSRELLNRAEQEIFTLSGSTSSQQSPSLKSVMTDVLSEIDLAHSNKKFARGIPTGLVDLDRVIIGLRPSYLCYVAARPSMGKTALSLNIVRHVCRMGIPVAVFSYEMSKVILASRVLFAEARVDSHRAWGGKLSTSEFEKISKASSQIADLPIFICDAVDDSSMTLRSRARRLVREKNVGLIVVDYAQLLRSEARSNTRNEEMTKISRELKMMAVELNIPVIALSQLSRNVETRGEKRPRLADMRDSGSIEQDADIIIAIYREEVYKQKPANKGVGELLVLKNRNGPIGNVRVTWLGEFTIFENFARQVEGETPE